MNPALHQAIVKGKVADYAGVLSKLEGVTDKTLAEILREIAHELDGK